jgi:phage-related protein
MDILYYSNSRGCQPVYDWIQHIKKHEPALYNKVYQTQVMLRRNGSLIQSGEVKKKNIKKLKGTDIWQIRINDDRILFFYFAGDSIVMTNQFRKKQNSTPQTEIDRAENRKKEFLKNN